jgi:hypothetical protein
MTNGQTAGEPVGNSLSAPMASPQPETLPFRERLTRDDAAIGRLFQDILDVVAEADQDASFCGFQIQVGRNTDGCPIFIRLVLCDNLGGIIAPREAFNG